MAHLSLRRLPDPGASPGADLRPGPRWFRREAGRVLQMLQNDSSLRAAAQHAATVWAWAQSRGLVRDDGVYRFAYRVDVEEGRRRAAERLDYLRTKGR